MSHYRVFVIHKPDQNYEDLLAPYDENLEVEPYLEYTREQAIVYARKAYPNLSEGKDDEACFQLVAEDYPEDCVDKDGNIYSTYNPQSKWDWYCIGGRFGLIDENEEEIMVKDFKNTIDMDEYNWRLRFWDIAVEGAPLKENEDAVDFESIYKPEYFKERYGTRERFAEYNSRDIPYAVVTPDGEWHSVGTMGWFGISDDDKDTDTWMKEFDDIIKNSDPYDRIISIDCHI